MNLVGERVRQARLKQDVSQDTLCGRIAEQTRGLWGPTRDDVYRIESGNRIVSDLEALALAAALGCEVEWLIKGDDGESTAHLAERLFGIEK